MINLIGFLLPPLIDLINGKIVSQSARFWVSVGVCSIFGIFVAFVETNGFKGLILVADYIEVVAKSILVMFGIAQLVYHGGYGDTKLHDEVRSKAIDIK